jgi:hypothetical protein
MKEEAAMEFRWQISKQDLLQLRKYPKVRIDESPRRPQTLHQVQFLVFRHQVKTENVTVPKANCVMGKLRLFVQLYITFI